MTALGRLCIAYIILLYGFGEVAVSRPEAAQAPTRPGSEVGLHGVQVQWGSASPLVTIEARRLMENLRHTRYSFRNEIVEADGKYHVVCSGLVAYIIRRALDMDQNEVLFRRGGAWPRVKHFWNDLVDAPTEPHENRRWQRITNLYDVEPGDLLLWRRDMTSSQGNHILVIDSEPQTEKNGLIRLRIIHSDRNPHADDQPGGRGVSRGVRWFRVDEAGRILAVTANLDEEPRERLFLVARMLKREWASGVHPSGGAVANGK